MRLGWRLENDPIDPTQSLPILGRELDFVFESRRHEGNEGHEERKRFVMIVKFRLFVMGRYDATQPTI